MLFIDRAKVDMTSTPHRDVHVVLDIGNLESSPLTLSPVPDSERGSAGLSSPTSGFIVGSMAVVALKSGSPECSGLAPSRVCALRCHVDKPTPRGQVIGHDIRFNATVVDSLTVREPGMNDDPIDIFVLRLHAAAPNLAWFQAGMREPTVVGELRPSSFVVHESGDAKPKDRPASMSETMAASLAAGCLALRGRPAAIADKQGGKTGSAMCQH